MRKRLKIKKVTLYDIKRQNGDWFNLEAYIDPSTNTLILEGQDFSSLAEDMFGDEEYEYFYTFNEDAIQKLKIVLNNKDVLVGLTNYFHGEMHNNDFLKLCENNKIPYEIHVV